MVCPCNPPKGVFQGHPFRYYSSPPAGGCGVAAPIPHTIEGRMGRGWEMIINEKTP